jgi:hypothetical protein
VLETKTQELIGQVAWVGKEEKSQQILGKLKKWRDNTAMSFREMFCELWTCRKQVYDSIQRRCFVS